MRPCMATCRIDLNLTEHFNYARGGRFANCAHMATEHRTLILVVADHLWVREIVSSFLSSHAFDVRVATDGQEALDLFQNGVRPNVLIVDLTESKVSDAE